MGAQQPQMDLSHNQMYQMPNMMQQQQPQQPPQQQQAGMMNMSHTGMPHQVCVSLCYILSIDSCVCVSMCVLLYRQGSHIFENPCKNRIIPKALEVPEFGQECNL